MRKIYTPITILTAAVMIGLTGCHGSEIKSVDPSLQRHIDAINQGIKQFTHYLPDYAKKADQEGRAAGKMLHDWGEAVDKKYPHPLEDYGPFDHSVGKQQSLLLTEVSNNYFTDHVVLPYAKTTGHSQVLPDFEKAVAHLPLYGDTYFQYDLSKGQDKSVILGRIQPLMDAADRLLVSLQRLLAFDYSKVEPEFHGFINHAWHHFYKENINAYGFKGSLFNIENYIQDLK